MSNIKVTTTYTLFQDHEHTGAADGGVLTNPRISQGMRFGSGGNGIDIAALAASPGDELNIIREAVGNIVYMVPSGDSANCGLIVKSVGLGPIRLDGNIEIACYSGAGKIGFNSATPTVQLSHIPDVTTIPGVGVDFVSPDEIDFVFTAIATSINSIIDALEALGIASTT